MQNVVFRGYRDAETHIAHIAHIAHVPNRQRLAVASCPGLLCDLHFAQRGAFMDAFPP